MGRKASRHLANKIILTLYQSLGICSPSPRSTRVLSISEPTMSATDEYSTSYLAENQGPVLLKVAISVIVLDTVFLILYTISRLMNRSFKGWDVYFMLVTYVFVMTDAAMAFGKSHLADHRQLTDKHDSGSHIRWSWPSRCCRRARCG